MEAFKDFIVFNKEFDSFSWFGSAEQLKEFLQFVCNSHEDEQERHLETSEDSVHNAVTYKLHESSVRFYYTTTNIKLFGKSTFIRAKLNELLLLSNGPCPSTSAISSTTCGDSTECLPDTAAQATGVSSGQDTVILEALKCQILSLTRSVNKVQQDLSDMKNAVGKPLNERIVHSGEVDRYKETISEQQQEIKSLNDQLNKSNQENKSLLTVIYMLTNTKESQVKEIPHDVISSTSDDDVYVNDGMKKSSGIPPKYGDTKPKNSKKKRSKQIAKDEPTTSTEKLTSARDDDQPSATKKSSTVILGDSIISKVDGWRISSRTNRVSVKSFSGAKVEDMMHYVRPTLLHKPDNVILHVGTNNLKFNSAPEITEKIHQLCQLIRTESPSTKLAISELMPRKDSKDADQVRQAVNLSLEELCSQNEWSLLKHPLLNEHSTNFRGIHPNNRGTAILAQDFKNFISNNN